MKNLIKLFAIAFFALMCSSASAQTFKFGHVNFQELIMLTPDYDSATVKFTTYQQSLEEDLLALQTELQTKLAAYEKNANTWTAALLEMKQRELQEMNQRTEDYRQTAAQELNNMNQVLMLPVMEKVSNAIKKIGKEQGFIYIFDISGNAIPYYNPDQSTDLMEVMKRELNIPLDKKLPTATPQQ